MACEWRIADIPVDSLDPQGKSLNNFACVGAEEVQAQHWLRAEKDSSQESFHPVAE